MFLYGEASIESYDLIGWQAFDGLADELARHFPGQGPAIRAVADHILEMTVDERGICCMEEGA